MSEWWQSFFDDDYLHVWGADNQSRTAAEVDGLWQLLALAPGSRVLDAPCGYGRISQPLAARGAVVLGVDQSEPLLAHAERNRDGVGSDRLKYRHHDLRAPLDDGGFDAAVNVFSSLGYGDEDDDLAVLTTLRRAVHAGGRVFVDTNHRDVMATYTELVALMKRAGLALVSAHQGCSPEPFVTEGPSLGGRVGLVARPL